MRDEATVRVGLEKCGVPMHLREGLFHYVTAYRPVGGFLTAFLSNDLMGAAGAADPESGHSLFRIALFLRNYAPEECYGSPRKVEAWLGRFKTEAR